MSNQNNCNKKIAIIGAGPAGLTAAYLLAKAGQQVIVFEKDPIYVGGISRTESYKGYLFDIGGHRFFSKSSEVEAFWNEILGDEFLDRPRKSRIYYKQQFFSYPLVAKDALLKLGIKESFLCVLSYLKARIKPKRQANNFEDWVINQFGERLFNIFFKTYTEKVWGISCKEISADWAAQRIKGLSLKTAIYHALFPPKKKGSDKVIKTLIDSFRYPKFGPGQMWEVCAQKMKDFGGQLIMNTGVTGLYYDDEKMQWHLATSDGQTHEAFDEVISTAPIKELIPNIHPSVSMPAAQSSQQLEYRDFLTVVLIVNEQDAFDDNWIYIHDPSVKVGRIQNFKSWSPYMVPDPTKACYGLEYFCFEGDGIWTMENKDLIALATKEMSAIGLVKAEDIVDGCVVRQPKAYPVYDHQYKERVKDVIEGLEQFKGLQLVGRNGMHKYNNQDHSMMTAMLAVQNILNGDQCFDLWKVNQDAEYHEEGNGKEGGRLVPQAVNGNKY